jgi:hypothetical protein
MAKRTETVRTCCSCGDVLGEKARIIPVSVPSDEGDGRGAAEDWCPQCFVWVRAPQSPGRWYWPSIVAVRCLSDACGKTCVDFTASTTPLGPQAKCSQCGHKRLMLLPAKAAGHAGLGTLVNALAPKTARAS